MPLLEAVLHHRNRYKRVVPKVRRVLHTPGTTTIEPVD